MTLRTSLSKQQEEEGNRVLKVSELHSLAWIDSKIVLFEFFVVVEIVNSWCDFLFNFEYLLNYYCEICSFGADFFGEEMQK